MLSGIVEDCSQNAHLHAGKLEAVLQVGQRRFAFRCGRIVVRFVSAREKISAGEELHGRKNRGIVSTPSRFLICLVHNVCY